MFRAKRNLPPVACLRRRCRSGRGVVAYAVSNHPQAVGLDISPCDARGRYDVLCHALTAGRNRRVIIVNHAYQSVVGWCLPTIV